jgi:hypothetical protein
MSGLVFVVAISFVLGLGFWVRHLSESSWQKGFKEGFHQGLQQKVVKVQKAKEEKL